MMRVLLVMTAREIGGAELYVERLVNSLAAECRFTIAISDHPALAALRQRLAEHARVVPFAFDDARALIGIARRLRSLAAENDVVHLNSNHPASRLGIFFPFALSRLPAPLVCVEHRATPVADVQVPRVLAPFLPTWFRWSRRNAARVIAVSDENAHTLTEYYHLPPARIRVIPNGVELAPFQLTAAEHLRARRALRNELQLQEGQPIVLVLTRLTPNKGHRYLIQAAPEILAHFPDAHFVFAGSPDERAAIEKQIGQFRLARNFSILGFRSDTISLLHTSDVFVLPSLAEGFALSLIEALASGLPVVATRVGGAPEVIRDGENGFLVPPADSSALAQAVTRALSLDESAREQMRQAALVTARAFSIETMGNKMLSLYRDVIGKH